MQNQPYPDHTERFDGEQPQVLCREGLSERHYWEVEVERELWVGLTYRSIVRKGWRAPCALGDNDKSWCLSWFGSKLFVYHNHKETLLPVKFFKPSRVGVYLNWPAGVLSFYSISSDTMTHLYTFNTTFSEPLYPGFGFPVASFPPPSVTLCRLE